MIREVRSLADWSKQCALQITTEPYVIISFIISHHHHHWHHSDSTNGCGSSHRHDQSGSGNATAPPHRGNRPKPNSSNLVLTLIGAKARQAVQKQAAKTRRPLQCGCVKSGCSRAKKRSNASTQAHKGQSAGPSSHRYGDPTAVDSFSGSWGTLTGRMGGVWGSLVCRRGRPCHLLHHLQNGASVAEGLLNAWVLVC